ncbi:ABC transporter ATP-binding protein [Maritimibacter alexandrii]|jgi:branched-chain amino acid transport system ATP-binding protein|uniref:ABC transporter ATP-binding protein n=1 Tax=Maritimibacter alexandrii TaxID=2570355 RepID=UPI00110930A3|nr:ABC transporter ATP-binding protein [Maritimibacter alexandrii]
MAKEIAWNSVDAGYGRTVAVEGITVRLSAGEKLGILGRNGAGKTTILRAMMGDAKVHHGTVEIDGVDVTGMPAYQRNQLGVAVVPQTRDVFRSLTVRENLIVASAERDRTKLAVKLFPRLGERMQNLGADLSGGEQQMLSIARAIMTKPDFLMLDEPLEGLSPTLAQDVMKSVRKMVEETGLGCVLVEQHVATVLDFCDRALVVQRGQMVFSGTTDELRGRPDVLESAIGLSAVSSENE